MIVKCYGHVISWWPKTTFRMNKAQMGQKYVSGFPTSRQQLEFIVTLYLFVAWAIYCYYECWNKLIKLDALSLVSSILPYHRDRVYFCSLNRKRENILFPNIPYTSYLFIFNNYVSSGTYLVVNW